MVLKRKGKKSTVGAPQSSAFVFSRPNRQLLLWLAKTYVRPHRWRLVGAAVAMAVTAATTAALAWLLKPVIDGFVANASASDFWQTPLLLLFVLIANGIALYFQATLVQEVGQKIVARLQVELFDHFTAADLSYRFEHHTGNLINRCVHDTGLVQNAVSGALLSILRDSLMFLLLVGVVVARDWVLAVSTVLILPLLGLGIAFLSKRARRLTQESMTRAGELTTAIHEAFEGVRLVKVYGAEKTESARVAKAVEERRKASSALTRVRALTSPLSEILCGISLVAALYYGWGEATAGRLTLGDLGSFLAALLLAYRPLKRLASFNVTLQEGLVAAERIRETLAFKPKVIERPGAPALQVKGGEVRFEGVHFSYGSGEEVLRGIDLVAPAGKTVALVGVSGAGKSTILNLIPRLYDVSAGRITIDGVDIRDVSLSSLRQAMAMVTQETLLFDETVQANIAYSNPEASQAEIEAAARGAAAHDFIQALPEGYATHVKQHGQRLSGGQRQRLAIARAMLRRAPILLLDEATSALDNEAEQQVKTALQHLMQGRTTLMVAHRLSTVIDASIIYVLSGGQVIECGDHASLVRQAGTYARLYAADGENALA